MADILAGVIFTHAMLGDFAFVREILDRAEGKAKATVDMKVDEGPQVVIYIPDNGRDTTDGDPPAAGPANGVL